MVLLSYGRWFWVVLFIIGVYVEELLLIVYGGVKGYVVYYRFVSKDGVEERLRCIGGYVYDMSDDWVGLLKGIWGGFGWY